MDIKGNVFDIEATLDIEGFDIEETLDIGVARFQMQSKLEGYDISVHEQLVVLADPVARA